MKTKLALYLIPLVLIILSGSFALAWTNPIGNPPAGGGIIGAESGAPINSIRIRSTGNVGIGTTDPAGRLQVNAPATTAASLTWGAVAGQIFRNENSELAIGLLNASPWPLWLQGRTSTNVARDIAINPLGGNVGIGTTSPAHRLDVAGDINLPATGFLRIAGNAGATNQVLTRTATGMSWAAGVGGVTWPLLSTADGTATAPTYSWSANTNMGIRRGGTDDLRFVTAGADRLTINSTGNVGIGTATPGARLEIFGTPGTQRITTIPAGTTGTYTLSWDALQICQFGTCSPPWRDLDGDGRTYQARTDCDEGCPTCFVGSTTTTGTVDGRDQNCNGIIDEGSPMHVEYFGNANFNCNHICQHVQPCQSVGTNIGGTNGLIFFTQDGLTGVEAPGNCSTMLNHIPPFPGMLHVTWTHCRCGIGFQ